MTTLGGIEIAGGTWAKSPEEIAAWGRKAKPGDRFIYAHGPKLPGEAGRAARALCDAGAAITHNVRSADGMFDYLAVRRDEEKHGRPTAKPEMVPSAMDRLLLVLTKCADQRLVCPTNAVLAERAQLRDSSHVSVTMQRLIHRGAIVIATAEGVRIVTICQSMKRTRDPRVPA